jgi:negative regulator of flagellin synthesis FlgM
MMEREELRSERVDHLRNMIENESYVVNPEGVAQKMLEELW